MELETRDGYIYVSKKEYESNLRFIELFGKFFSSGYMVFNRQLNNIRKEGEKLVKPTKREVNDD